MFQLSRTSINGDKMISRFSLTAIAAALSVGSACSFAAPVGIDGLIGAEWNGVPVVTVTHDPSAPESNFGAPGTTTRGASYSIQVRDDGTYYYVALKVTGDALSNAGNFANLYFDTDPLAGNGSDVGFEVTNNRYFIAGAAGDYDASPYLTFDGTSNPGTIELAIANTFFTSGPKAGVAFPNGYPAATGDVTLRLSQSFGYSVAGGGSYGPTRLGSASVAAAQVPEPGSLALVALGLVGLATLRRRRN
jgi:hypothetical protein